MNLIDYANEIHIKISFQSTTIIQISQKGYDSIQLPWHSNKLIDMIYNFVDLRFGRLFISLSNECIVALQTGLFYLNM